MTLRAYVPWIAGLFVAAAGAAGLAGAHNLVRPVPSVPARVEPEHRPASEPGPVGPNRLFFVGGDGLLLCDPDGKNQKKVDDKHDPMRPAQVRLSPNGKTLARLVAPAVPPDQQPDPSQPGTLHVRGLDEKGPGTSLGIECHSFAWSADGTEIVFSSAGEPRPGPPRRGAGTRNRERQDEGPNPPQNPGRPPHSRLGVRREALPDPGGNDEDWATTLYLVDRAGTDCEPVNDPKEEGWAPGSHRTENECSTTAGRTLCRSSRTIPPSGFSTWTRASGRKVSNIAAAGMLTAFCWSADGKRIAYTWLESVADQNGDTWTVARLVTCDPDGRHPVAVELAKTRDYGARAGGGRLALMQLSEEVVRQCFHGYEEGIPCVFGCSRA